MAQIEAPLNQALPAEEDVINEVGELSQWQLMRIRFAKNKLAMTGIIGLVIMYVVVFLGPFLGPNAYDFQNSDAIYANPSPITFIGPNGQFGLRPYTYDVSSVLDEKSFKFVYTIDYSKKLPIEFFIKGDPITLLGFIKTDTHLFGLANGKRLYPLGADSLGRDMFSRILVGGQISLTVGLLGVALSLIMGTVLGTMSGFFGGAVDDVMQRIIEVLMSFPGVPLWAALAAALPPISSGFTGIDRYFLITVVLSILGWTGLARALRAKVMSYRQADFANAALAAGSSDMRIVITHMIPNASSHIIVSAALSIPGMILGETSLSFLGLGILPPLVSWGALLKDAQQVTVVIYHPWLMIPGLAVIIAVLFFSFLGDGLRDAVDPYSI